MGKFIDLPPRCSPTPRIRSGSCGRWSPRRRSRASSPRCRIARANPSWKAKCNDPTTWAPFDVALNAFKAGRVDGIGFCLLGTDLGAFDLDDCRDPQTGELGTRSARAGRQGQELHRDHAFRFRPAHHPEGDGREAAPCQPVPNANGMKIETYRRCERFITVTGNILPGAPDQIADGDALLDETVAKLDAAKQAGQGRPEGRSRPKGKRRSSISTTSSRTARAAISAATVPPRCGG